MSWAHSWIDTDRDGHRARVTFATPSDLVRAEMTEAMVARGDFEEKPQPPKVISHEWHFTGDYAQSEEPLETVHQTLRKILLAQGYLPIDTPGVTAHTLNPPELLKLQL